MGMLHVAESDVDKLKSHVYVPKLQAAADSRDIATSSGNGVGAGKGRGKVKVKAKAKGKAKGKAKAETGNRRKREILQVENEKENEDGNGNGKKRQRLDVEGYGEPVSATTNQTPTNVNIDINNSSEDGGDRITLVKQELSFDLSGVKGARNIKGLLTKNDGYFEVTNVAISVACNTKAEATATTIRVSHGEVVLLEICCAAELPQQTLLDLEFGTSVVQAQTVRIRPHQYRHITRAFAARSALAFGGDISDPHRAHLSLVVELLPDAPQPIEFRPALTFVETSFLAADLSLSSLSLHGNGKTGSTAPPGGSEKVTARDFYNSAIVLPKEEVVPEAIQHAELECSLLPFQTRTVRWMMRREGVDVQDGSHELVPYDQPPAENVPGVCFETQDRLGRKIYISLVHGMITKNRELICEQIRHVRGGILAEEMGLGKTVELIALVTLNRRPVDSEPMLLDEYSGTKVRKSGATLIITPRSILHQWLSELQTHAPHLRVHHYQGLKRGDKLSDDYVAVKDLLDYDIVITTYDVLRSEVYFAQEVAERYLERWDEERRKMRSPLIGISWWRVCLDEAQLVESGVTAAAKVARLIPRINAWCVTGTPVRKDVDDLFGLLIFLRYEPFCNTWHWKNLIQTKTGFKTLFSNIAVRHSKADVRGEVDLPPQKRVVVTVPFSPIEEVNYTAHFARMVEECEIDEDGCAGLNDPARRGQLLESMRWWLLRLRQMCSHAQVGRVAVNKRGVGAPEGPLRTVEEVLDQMIEEHHASLRSEERAYVCCIIKRGQFLENKERYDEALQVYKEAYEALKPIVEQCREALAEEQRRVEELQSHTKHDRRAAAATASGNAKGKQKAKDSYEEEYDEDDLEEGYSGDEDREEKVLEASGRIGVLRLRLRGFLVVEHSCLFFLGTIYYLLKAKEEERKGERVAEFEAKETEFYAAAKAVRKELLTETEGKAQKFIDSAKKKAESQSFVEIPELKPSEFRGGIETQTFAEDLLQLEEALNTQANHLDEWREEMVQILISPLVDQDEDANGDEFEKSMALQEKGFAYMEAINAAITDRDEALTGRQNLLAQEELARALTRREEYTNVLRKLVAQKNTFNPVGNISMKQILNRLRAIATGSKVTGFSTTRSDLEKQLADMAHKRLLKQYNEQNKVITQLKREGDFYRNTINARVQFYRQLQALSDSVTPFNPEAEKRLTLKKLEAEEGGILARITQQRAKSNYLSHLKLSDSVDGRTCIICQSEFEDGCITTCGHQYCLECIVAWCKQHKTCPMCKHKLDKKELHPVTYAPKKVAIQQEEHVASITPNGDAVHAIYSDIQDRMFEQIKMTTLQYSYGSKMDMICKHILSITRADATAKAVVFSQWSNVLTIFQQAFRANGIKFATLERDGVTRFKNDPDVKCFLLHAKSQSAGLTLVNATHVFICEPLLNAGLELQAISRVHRIGQTRPTTVWLYVVNNTVEQSVLELATRRRLALMGVKFKDAEAAGGEGMDVDGDGDAGGGDGDIEITENRLDEANSITLTELAQPKRRGANAEVDVVVEDDLVGCLVRSARGRLEKGRKEERARRELLAGAAEGRMEMEGAGEGASG